MLRQPNILQDQAGSVLPLFALSIPIALAGIGVALDYSSLTRRRADLQVAADTAALHATKVLAQSTAGSAAEKEQEARKAAERLLALQTPKAAKTITPLASDRSVTIDLSESKDLRFASWLGGSSKTIGADAKATYSDKPAGCVIAVGQGEEPGIELVGSAKITAPNAASGPIRPARTRSPLKEPQASRPATFAASAERARLTVPRRPRAAVRRLPIPTKRASFVAVRTRARAARPTN